MTIIISSHLLRRFTAAIIDYGVFVVFFSWLVYTYGKPNDEGGYTLENDPKTLWIPVVWMAYFPVAESIKGQTLGKMILGLKVVSKRGRQVSFMQALKRHIADCLDAFFFGLVAVISIKNSPAHQRLGDLWADTIVIGNEDVACQQCGAQLTITADEIVKSAFVCPTCQATNSISKRIKGKTAF